MLKVNAMMVRMIQRDRKSIEEQIEKAIAEAIKTDDCYIIEAFGSKVDLAIEIATEAGFYVEIDHETLRISW